MNREDLNQRIAAIHELLSAIVNDDTTWNSLNPHTLKQFTTGVNKAYGQALAFQHEYMTTRKYQQKLRYLTTQEFGDVTVGFSDDLFAKTIECKSITAETSGAVNAAIAKALEQLGGQTGFLPRDGDVRVIDVSIDGFYNPWPMPGGAYGTYRPRVHIEELKQAAIRQVQSFLDTTKPGAEQVMHWLCGEEITNFMGGGRLGEFVFEGQRPFPNSTRPFYVAPNSQLRPVRCLTIKVRWTPQYLLAAPMNVFDAIHMIAIQVYLPPGTTDLRVEVVKVGRSYYENAPELFPMVDELWLDYNAFGWNG